MINQPDRLLTVLALFTRVLGCYGGRALRQNALGAANSVATAAAGAVAARGRERGLIFQDHVSFGAGRQIESVDSRSLGGCKRIGFCT